MPPLNMVSAPTSSPVRELNQTPVIAYAALDSPRARHSSALR
jgi:hypothetical protein